MPSSKKAIDAMVRLIPENTRGTIYELGSGWGGLAFRLAKRCPQAKIVAVELSAVPYSISRLRQLLFPLANVVIVRKDFHTLNLSDAKAVVCYLFPQGMKRLGPKLKKELPENTAVISNTFALEGWKNESVFFLEDWSSTRIYL